MRKTFVSVVDGRKTFISHTDGRMNFIEKSESERKTVVFVESNENSFIVKSPLKSQITVVDEKPAIVIEGPKNRVSVLYSAVVVKGEKGDKGDSLMYWTSSNW